MTTTRGLVLGGGGLAGIAWETGVLAGLATSGVDIPGGTDRVWGTSAGSTVAGQLASRLPLPELFRRQADPALQNHELAPDPAAVARLMAAWTQLPTENGDPLELRRQAGRMALATETVPAEARLGVIAGRLPEHDWPDWPLVLVAVDAGTGEPRLFDRHSGVGLVKAVAASCAVPGIWPTVEIDGRPYMDGGMRSANNADLADTDRVLVLAPMADPALAGEVAALEKSGANVLVIAPDETSVAAFGSNPLDLAARTPAAHAGLAQGSRLADAVRKLWA